MADLKSLIPTNNTIVINLLIDDEVIKNDDGTPMTVEVYLPHSKEYRDARHAQADKMIDSRQERLKSAEAEEMTFDFLAKTTKTWDITFDGKKPNFSVAKAKEIYEKLTWIPELILTEVDKSKSFTKA